jgi:acetate kinase
MREIEEAAAEGRQNAQLAFDIYCYRLKKYIGAYTVAMGGLDVLVFTGGIGENSAGVRARTCENMEFLGLELNDNKNEGVNGEANISDDNSRVKILVIPTNEELVIAEDTQEIVEKLNK